MAGTGLRFSLSVAGLPDNTFAVAGFTLQEHYSEVFLLELELASSQPTVDFAVVLDNSVTLTIWRDGDVQRIVNGIAVSMEQGDTGFRRTRYALSVRPTLWRASLVHNSRIFQQQDLKCIVETLLRKHGIHDYDFALRYKRAVREFCVQYQEDDLAFIQRMCAEEGIFYFFEHENNKHTLVFADDCAMQNKGPELPYNNTPAQELYVTALRRRESLRPSHILLKDYTFKNPPWNGEFKEQALDMQHQRQSYLHYDYPGRYKDITGQDFSRWRMEALRNDAHLGSGKSNCAALQPGNSFTLTDHPRDEMNARWQITAAIHTGKQPQALEEEGGEQGTIVTCEFAFIVWHQTWRPSVLDKPRIDGAQIAIVTGPPGEEIYCDEYGRVRVRFLWDRSGKTDDTSSCWIRVSQPWAGQKWGSLAIPRVGHEVIVEFLNGDPDQPVIIGRTYHVNHLPPGNLPLSKTQMSIRSKTHKGDGFNELRFEDEKDREEVFIHAQKDMDIQVRNSKNERIDYDRTSSIGHDEKLVVANNRIVTVEGQQDHKTAGNYITLVGGDSYHTINGDVSQKIKGTYGISATGSTVISSEENITFKVGSNFILIHSGGVNINGNDITVGPVFRVTSNGVPSALALPNSPAVLKAAAGVGTMFVAHCALQSPISDEETKTPQIDYEIKVDKKVRILTPLAVPDFEELSKGTTKNKDFVNFIIENIQDEADCVSFLGILDGESIVYTEKSQAQLDKLKSKGVHTWSWDGYDDNGVLNTRLLKSHTLKVRITAQKENQTYSFNLMLKNSAYEEDWLDAKIDRNKRQVDVDLRIGLSNGNTSGLHAKNVVPPIDYLTLQKMAEEAVSYYWSRDTHNKAHKGLGINVKEGFYQVTVKAKANEKPLMPKFKIIQHVEISKDSAGRSTSFWIFKKIDYNSGYWCFFKGVNYKNFADGRFSHTAAHEIGHMILNSYGDGGLIPKYSWGHKGSSGEISQKTNNSYSLPLIGEIDLMKYPSDDDFSRVNFQDYLWRSVAAEADVKSLLWLARIKFND